MRCDLGDELFVDEIDVDLDAIAHGGRTNHRADTHCGATTTADDTAEIAGADANFEKNATIATFGVRDIDRIGIVDDAANDVL